MLCIGTGWKHGVCRHSARVVCTLSRHGLARLCRGVCTHANDADTVVSPSAARTNILLALLTICCGTTSRSLLHSPLDQVSRSEGVITFEWGVVGVE